MELNLKHKGQRIEGSSSGGWKLGFSCGGKASATGMGFAVGSSIGMEEPVDIEETAIGNLTDMGDSRGKADTSRATRSGGSEGR